MHKNNFDFLRLLFAILVMVTHSYALTGHGNNDFMRIWTGGQIELSYLGVRGFFIISGYLIYQSLIRSHSIYDYVWKRLLRLFPALLVMLFLTVLLAWGLHDNSSGSFFSQKDAWTYFPKNASLYMIQGSIKGVFSTNASPNVINGSLWTISYEFTCYMLLLALFGLRKHQLWMRGILSFAFLALLIAIQFFFKQFGQFEYFLRGDRFIQLCAYFIAGSCLAAFNFEQVKAKNGIVLVALTALVAMVATGNFMTLPRFVLLPLVVIGFGVQAAPYLSQIGQRLGDPSYGLYIYGFVVQQTIANFVLLSPLQMFLLSFPITLLLALASWRWIEKPALQYKNKAPKLPRFA